MEQTDRPRTFQEVKVKGNQLLDKVRELIEEGNTRRIILKKEDRVLMEFPLSVGVGGTTAALLFTPHLAAIGTIVALVSDVRLIIERDTPDTETQPHGELITPEEATREAQP